MSGYRIIELVWLFVIGVYFFIPCYGWYKGQNQQPHYIDPYRLHQPINTKQPVPLETQNALSESMK